MKKSFFISICLILALSVYAGPVTEDQALEKARRFNPGKHYSLVQTAGQTRSDNTISDKPFYIFNAAENGGFVIVSGDDRTKEILGYSDRGNITDRNLPENVKWWLDYYTKAISSLRDSKTEGRAETRSQKTEIKPLIQTQWNQYSPFNDLCVFNGQTCVTGCVATAMAQIMNFYKYPASVSAIEGYESFPAATALPATSLTWENMKDEDMAKLSRYCGQAVRMQYGTYGSSTSSALIPLALVKYFGYSKSTHSVYRDGYTPEEWENTIYQELSDGHPVIYSGVSPTNSGHTFICDGYKDGLYHVNWGWGGYLDGYFVLTLMDSKGKEYINDTYSEEQMAVVGVRPTKEGVSDYPLLTVLALEAQSDLEVTRKDKKENFEGISFLTKFGNSANTEDKIVNLTFALFRGDKIVSQFDAYAVPLQPELIYSFIVMMDFGAGLADGTYRLEMLYNEGNQDYVMPQGHGYHYVEIVVKGNSLKMTNYPIAQKEDDILNDETISISDLGKSTYCSSNDLDFSEFGDDLKAYVATGYDPDSKTIWMTRVTDVPAGTGIFLKGKKGDYQVPVKASTSYYKNMLVGTLSSTSIPSTTDEYTNLYLAKDGGELKFCMIAGEGRTMGANKAYLQIPKTFKSRPASATATTESIKLTEGKSTYCSSNDLDFTSMGDALKAYVATGYTNSTGTIWMTRVYDVPAGTGIFLKGENKTHSVPTKVKGGSSQYESYLVNMLVGTLTKTHISSTTDTYKNMYLTKEDGVLKFCGIAGDGRDMNANRAYLQIPLGVLSKTRSVSFGEASYAPEFCEDVIGIPVEFGSTTSMMKVSTEDVEGDNVWYNLNGQRVENPGKGLYIRNGRKVVIK